MKKLLMSALFISIILFVESDVQAQSKIKIEELKLQCIDKNNVEVVFNIDQNLSKVKNKLATSDVNQKSGYSATLSENNAQLTLQFTKSFTENELNILFEESGIELNSSAFNQLLNLINQ